MGNISNGRVHTNRLFLEISSDYREPLVHDLEVNNP
jgi:hypothetical protein